MKTDRLIFRLFGMLCSVLLAAGAVVAQDAPEGGEKEKAAEAPAKLVIPRSVFVVEPIEKKVKEGIDPFHPNSRRRDPGPTPEEIAAEKARLAAEAAAQEAVKDSAPPPPSDPFDDLTLKAVIGGRRPLATISTSIKNYYFAPGEWRMVLVPNHVEGGQRLVRLECVSVTAKGVSLKIDNKDEVRPLKLPLKPIGN